MEEVKVEEEKKKNDDSRDVSLVKSGSLNPGIDEEDSVEESKDHHSNVEVVSSYKLDIEIA